MQLFLSIVIALGFAILVMVKQPVIQGIALGLAIFALLGWISHIVHVVTKTWLDMQ